jgi:membrane protease YdiL (CAAX protease family)
MQTNQDILDFNQLFEKPELPKSPNNIKGYVYAITTYLVVMFIVATMIFIIFSGIEGFVETVTPEDTVVETLIQDNSAISILPVGGYVITTLDSLDDTHNVYTYDGFDFIIHNTLTTFLVDDVFDFELFKAFLENDSNIFIVYFESNSYNGVIYDDLDVPLTYQSFERITTFALSLLNFIVYIFLFIPIVWFLMSDIRYDFFEFINKKHKIIGFILSGYIYVFLANFLATSLMEIISLITGFESSTPVNQEAILDMLSSDGLVFTLLSAIIIGPIVEELIFRKAIFGLIKHKYVALVVSSVIFGFIHVSSESSILVSLYQVIPYVSLGFVFGYLYLKHEKNIMIPIIVHMLSNFISIILTLFFL